MDRLDRPNSTWKNASSLEMATGTVTDVATINKYGHNADIASGTTADIWDRGSVAGGQLLWVAPTAARIHTIVSDSVADVAGGVGATTVDVYYLPDWDTEEQVERVSGDLNAGIEMDNAAVIIHRMVVIAQGSSTSINVGEIEADPATDTTITAQIAAGDGQTHMAIYGVPSVCDFYINNIETSATKGSGATGLAEMRLLVVDEPDIAKVSTGTPESLWTSKDTWGLLSTGSTAVRRTYDPPKRIAGPAIVKVQADAAIAGMAISAAFNGVLLRK